MLIIGALLVSALCLTIADAGKLEFGRFFKLFGRYTLQRPITIRKFCAYDYRVNNKLFAVKLSQYGSTRSFVSVILIEFPPWARILSGNYWSKFIGRVRVVCVNEWSVKFFCIIILSLSVIWMGLYLCMSVKVCTNDDQNMNHIHLSSWNDFLVLNGDVTM